MGSARYIIVARNDVTNELRLPLGDLTLYGCEPEGEEDLARHIASQFDEDWSIAIYAPMGSIWSGTIKKERPE